MMAEIVNISKNLIGGGVLSLSGGIAMYADNARAVVSAAFWTALMGIIFGYYCFLVARVSQMTHAATYREMWAETVGEAGAIAVPMANMLKAGLGNLAYSTILSQTLKSLLQTVDISLSRVACLFLVTIVGVLPLCLLKNLNVLAPFSVLGTSGILFIAFAMGYRYWDGSYVPGGQFYEDNVPELRASFGDRNQSFTLGVLPLVCMLYEAFVMHYNSARFYTELKNASLPRFAIAVSSAFGFSSVVYIAIACLGFLTFGGNSAPYILNNYSPYDPLATLSRLAVFISTLTTYPIVFIGCRDGMLDMLDVPPERQTSGNLNMLTVIMLAVLTFIAIFVTDLGFINAVGGGSLATIIVFVVPTIMWWVLAQEPRGKDEIKDLPLALGLCVCGIFLGVVGVVIELS